MRSPLSPPRRRHYPAVVPLLLLVLCYWPFTVQATADAAAVVREPAVLQRWLDRPQDYAISFLWFDRVADGRMTLQRDKVVGRYRAILEARTRGTSAWLTGDRVQRYETLMELTPAGRLLPLDHSAHIEKGKGEKRTIQTKRYLFDNHDHRVVVRRLKGGVDAEVKTIALQPGAAPDDFLTAFFNFSLGVYGEVREGRSYRIPTLTRNGISTIDVKVLPAAGRPAAAFFPAGGVLLEVTLDPEILDTGGGAVYARLDGDGLLERGIVKNVLGLGDVKGVRR